MTHDERSGLAVGKARGDGRGGVVLCYARDGGPLVGLWAAQPCWLPELTHGVQLVMKRAEAPIYKLFAGKAR